MGKAARIKRLRKTSADEKPPLPAPDLRGFREREYPGDLERGLFTLVIDDDHGRHIAQVWASTPGVAASLMAPWAKGRLRRAERHEEVPVELVGWDLVDPAEASRETGIPEGELDPGCLGVELVHVWSAEHLAEGKTATLYVIETIADGQGITDEPLF